jgi:hypothetical protein
MSDSIEIKIDGTRLTPEKFLDGVKEFLALVQGVAKNVAPERIDWLVSVEKSSAVVRMTAEHPTAHSRQAIDVVCQGIRALRNGVKTIPHGFRRENVSSAKIIASLVDGTDVQAVTIKNGADPESVPRSIVKVAEIILEGQNHLAFGSIEGKIVSLSAKHGYVCVIDDPAEMREITCYLQTEAAQKAAVDGYTKRVMASGLIHYAKEGHPVSITVDEMRIFPPDSELPTLSEVQEIYKLYK